MLKWKKEYEIGIASIDEQHRKLFEIAERAYLLLKDEFCVDKYDKIVAIIEELRDYAQYHFETEEEYMKKSGYRKFLSHKVEHDDFVAKVKGVDFRAVDAMQQQFLLDTLDFVMGWIARHILDSDKRITSKV